MVTCAPEVTELLVGNEKVRFFPLAICNCARCFVRFLTAIMSVRIRCHDGENERFL